MNTFPIRRAVLAFVLIIGVYLAPFTIVAGLAFVGIVFLPMFLEGVIVFFIADLLYGGAGAGTPFPYMLTISALLLLLVASAVRRTLRRRTL